MKITLRNSQSMFMSAIMVLGLVACSSSPSSWSGVDDSPWKSKRAAEASSTSADDFIEVPVDTPMQMAEPEAMVETLEAAPEQMPESIPEPEPEPIIVVEPTPAPVVTGIMAAPSTGYAVQVYAGVSEDSINRYKEAHSLYDLMTVRTLRDGKIMYVLVSLHDTRSAATSAATDIEHRTGSTPWVRTISGLQKIAVE